MYRAWRPCDREARNRAQCISRVLEWQEPRGYASDGAWFLF
jgi:hypothetical protein